MKSKSNLLNNICVVYTHHKLGDLIWQLPYIKAISEHHEVRIDLILRESTQAKKILQYTIRISRLIVLEMQQEILGKI